MHTSFFQPVNYGPLKPEGVTDWYETDQLPARSGVYEVTMQGDGRFCVFRYFDGVNWYEGGGTPNEALHHFQTTGHRADVVYRWRGLTEKTP